MATSKPTSTISYNTEGFLREHLEAWVNAHYIQAYMYIKHKGEEGDKDHIHLRIEPNKALDVMNLTEELREYVRTDPKPLGVRPWRPSKEEDWILYAVHDPEYMRLKYPGAKGEKIPYKWQDIQASECFDVEAAYIRAKATLAHTAPSLLNRLQAGESSTSLIQQGENAFTLNAIQRAIKSDNDIKMNDLQAELTECQRHLNNLLHAIHNAGFVVTIDAENNPTLEPKPQAIQERLARRECVSVDITGSCDIPDEFK